MQTIPEVALRRQGVDSFRVYSIFMIAWAHIQLFGNLSREWPLAKVAELTVTMGARFTMPFFFILAGYFTGGKIVREPSKALSIAGAYTKRLATIFLFWSFIYALEQPQTFLRLVQEQPVKLMLEGPRPHLWFLVSLILTVWLFVLWPFRKSHKSFLLLGGFLYVIGLLGGPYKLAPIGFDIHFNTRNAVFFSTLFFAIGVMFRDRMPQVNRRMVIGITLVGLVIFSLEAVYLRMQWGLSPSYQDYLLGTIPFGVGVSLFVLSQPDSSLDRLVGPCGRYMVGVFACHLLFLDLLAPFGSSVPPLVWQVVFPLLVFSLSLFTSVVISRTPLRRVVV